MIDKEKLIEILIVYGFFLVHSQTSSEKHRLKVLQNKSQNDGASYL